MPTLYVVATPIGNLEDVTLRALRTLSEVALIAAEDTRTTRKLLSRHGIKTPMVSYNEHNRTSRIPELLSALDTGDVALVSDAGTPAVSDPGCELVGAVMDSGGRVVPVPGPSALTVCMAVGLQGKDGVLFLGFLPRRKGDRRRLLDSVAALPYSLVVFEAPHRLRAALQAVVEALGDRRITACRELTKVHEEVFRGTVSEALEHFDRPRGEFTIMIEGARTPEAGPDDSWASAELGRLKAEGARARDAVDAVAAATGRRKTELYKLWLDTPRGSR
ncbi:MAG: 16S rRNA (cytidine(1402)-2'-O)-methyltransferase [Dehalococcoidia bacterium]|nr:16S rRNA (cytidine(1402)-2'-O)-methyltransferase [Dehalococcoidia bacterium]